MTYIGKLRTELSFIDHRDALLWTPVAKYLHDTLGESGFLIWLEWATRCDLVEGWNIGQRVAEMLGVKLP